MGKADRVLSTSAGTVNKEDFLELTFSTFSKAKKKAKTRDAFNCSMKG